MGPVVLMLVVMVGFWQVALGISALKFDLIDVVFPFRYHFSECIQADIFPFWNPYLQTGTPFFADLQVPFYYPELLWVSLAGGYSVYTMHLLFVGYVAMAALGMYRLAFYFNRHRIASLVAGVAYALSGYITGHGQHFFLLVGAAWIPWVILYYIRMCREPNPLLILKTGVFVFLLVTGAYQALSVVMAYLLAGLFLLFLGQSLRHPSGLPWRTLLIRNLLLLLLIAALCSPLIASVLEIRGQVARLGEGVSLEKTLQYVQSPVFLSTFVVPAHFLSQPKFLGNIDISMINHSIGIITLLFLIPALVRRRSTLEYVILAFGLIIFASSFSIPLRTLMYRYLPMMNLFLYPAFTRVFGLLALILVASGGMARFDLLKGPRMRWVFVLAGAELVGAAWFQMHATVTDREHNPFRMQNDLSLYPEGFPVPYDVPIAFNDDQHAFFTPFWRNTGVFTKRVSVSAFSSFQLNSYSKFDDQHPRLKQAVLQNRLFYFSDSLVPESRFSDSLIRPADTRLLVVSDEDYAALKRQRMQCDTADRVTLRHFSPNRVEASTHTAGPQYLAMLQTRFAGWRCYLDGKEVPSFTSNFNFRTIVLPAGEHTVTWEYRNNLILILYIFSNLLFVGILLFLFWSGWKTKAPNTLLRLGVPVAMVVLPAILLARVLVAEPGAETIHDWNHQQWPSLTENSKSKGCNSQLFDIEYHIDTLNISPEDEFIPLATLRPKADKTMSGTLAVRFQMWTDSITTALVVSDIQPVEGNPIAWHADKTERQIEHPNRWNEVIYTRNFYGIKPGGKVRVYLWNTGKGKFRVRNVRVMSYAL